MQHDSFTNGRYKEDDSSSYIKFTDLRGFRDHMFVEADSYNFATKKPDFSKRRGRATAIQADNRDVYLVNYIKEDGSEYGCIYAPPLSKLGHVITAKGVWSPDSV